MRKFALAVLISLVGIVGLTGAGVVVNHTATASAHEISTTVVAQHATTASAPDSANASEPDQTTGCPPGYWLWPQGYCLSYPPGGSPQVVYQPPYQQPYQPYYQPQPQPQPYYPQPVVASDDSACFSYVGLMYGYQMYYNWCDGYYVVLRTDYGCWSDWNGYAAADCRGGYDQRHPTHRHH